MLHLTKIMICLVAFFSVSSLAIGQNTQVVGDDTAAGSPKTAVDGSETPGDEPVPAPSDQTATAEATPKAPSVWKAFFPDGLLDADGKPVGVDVLQGKIVGLYFSAHWCPPCRAFSPKLVEFRDAHADEFEVVFISSDKTEEAQFEYMKEVKMNWYTVKHKSGPAMAASGKYGVRSIPTLVILSPSGDIISPQGRAEVSRSPDSCLDEWKAQAEGLGR